MTRIALEHEHAFYLHASNIHNSHSETYGPFPGTPYLTYEFIRDGEGNHVFSFDDPRIDDDVLLKAADAHIDGQCSDDHWHDQEGEYRRDGWRRCFDDHPQEFGVGGRFGVCHGAFWTDVGIEVVPAGELEYDRATYNLHPDPRVRAETTFRTDTTIS